MTDEQNRAIAARGQVLVSASAGAGKTTVMIERLVGILLGEDGNAPASLDDVLAVTFTKKAAAQMKSKLREKLIERLGNTQCESTRKHVVEQLNKIGTADISTIDSFCTRLIRTYFYALDGEDGTGVDAGFEVLADGAEAEELRSRTVDELFDRLYQEDDAHLKTLLKYYRTKRSDADLKKKILKAYDDARVYGNYRERLEKILQNAYGDGGFERAAEELNRICKDEAQRCVDAIGAFIKENPAPQKNGDRYLAHINAWKNCHLNIVNSGIFDAPKQGPDSKKAEGKKPDKCAENLAYDEKYTSLRDGVKSCFFDLVADVESLEKEREKFDLCREIAVAFTHVLFAFDEAYMRVKREEGKLDFADLAHLTLSLTDPRTGDKDVIKQINEKYKFVFVDEYQDVNPIQEEIINRVGHGDVFCVGDLKQAIYGFRGSNSRFFADKCEAADKDNFHVLPDNFRSAKAVINFVNSVFLKAMNKNVCSFDYANGHEMKFGGLYPDGYDGVAKICTFKKSPEPTAKADGVYSVTEEARKVKGYSDEGLAILGLVKEALKGEYYDTDEKVMKKVEAGDICVLTRKRSNAEVQGIVRALTLEYSVATAAETNILDRPEIINLIDVLSFIVNGEQDVPLVSALLSPLGGLRPEELVQIKLEGGRGEIRPLFRDCAKKFAESGVGALADRVRKFYARVENLRTLSDGLGADKIIDEIMLIDGFAAKFDTENKRFALSRLRQEAYGAMGELSLHAFLMRIEAQDGEIMANTPLDSDCVKVMTMHTAKGLEFPVVIVADVAETFKGDTRGKTAFDCEYGFLHKYYDEQTRVSGNNMLTKLGKMRKREEEVGNELNLFYVACTRAKYALYVLASSLPAYNDVTARHAKSFAHFFDKSWAGECVAVTGAKPEDGDGAPALSTDDADADIYEALIEAAGKAYSHPLAIGLPVKCSATRLMKERDDLQDESVFADTDEELPDGDGLSATPEGEESATGAGASASEEGTAYHRFLELCDFAKTDVGEIEEQIKEFVQEGLMTGGQGELLSARKLSEILSSPVFGEIRGKTAYREREFICYVPSCDYLSLKEGGGLAEDGEDDGSVMFQGAIDLLCPEFKDGKAVSAHVIDYKFTRRGDAKVKEHYAPQLALYKKVVCQIYGLPPEKVRCTIINLMRQTQIEM